MVGILVLALIVYGSFNVAKLPIDAVPDITNNQVLVITPSPSLGAADIERLITFPIEQATINIPGIIEQRSFSRFGLSLVTIVFNEKTDVYWARQQVSERLLQIQSEIPPALGVPHMGPVTTGLGEIFQYVVKAKPGYENKFDVTLKTLLGLGPKTDYAKLMQEGAIVIDVRSKAEFQSGHIRHSINIPLETLQKNLSKLKKDCCIICCCASGIRSASAKNILQSNGYTKVYNGGGWRSLENKMN